MKDNYRPSQSGSVFHFTALPGSGESVSRQIILTEWYNSVIIQLPECVNVFALLSNSLFTLGSTKSFALIRGERKGEKKGEKKRWMEWCITCPRQTNVAKRMVPHRIPSSRSMRNPPITERMTLGQE